MDFSLQNGRVGFRRALIFDIFPGSSGGMSIQATASCDEQARLVFLVASGTNDERRRINSNVIMINVIHKILWYNEEKNVYINCLTKSPHEFDRGLSRLEVLHRHVEGLASFFFWSCQMTELRGESLALFILSL